MLKRKLKKVGLALGSGGAKGLVHIGVIKELEKAGIKIDYIAGSSAGSLVGGLYAYFGEIKPVEEFFSSLTYRKMIELFYDPTTSPGLIKGEKLRKYLDSYVDGVNIEDLNTSFKAIATNFITGEMIILDQGKLSSVIRASSSVPVALSPFKIHNQTLADGGLSMSVPVDIARDMGAKFVAAVNLDSVFFNQKMIEKKGKKLSAINMADRTLDLLRYSLAKENCKNADYVITPNIEDVGWDKFANGREKIIKEGERQGKELVAFLKKNYRIR